jgi:FtsP/CotA-like multicopper oxidase with cupredoxin domain
LKQVGGGAALALIVEDPDGYLPDEVANAKDVLLFVQDMDLKTLAATAESSGDEKLVITPDPSTAASFRIVNGQHQPELTMQPGEWQRWRVVMGGWLKNPLGLYIDEATCEMQLLAKDGVYIEDFPRLITNAPIPTGGRADIMVRCTEAGEFAVSDYANTLMTIKVAVSSDDLPEWSPERPDYLLDLQDAEVDDPNCSCVTSFSPLTPDCTDGGTHCINQLSFEADRFLHTTVYGSLVERELQGTSAHPYHQHVYPFQMTEIVEGSTALTDEQKNYFQVGDWHDVVMIPSVDTVTMKYLPEVHFGRIMLHCHRLDHEDKGMMAQEEVVHSSVGSCQCEANAARATCEDDEDWEGQSRRRYLKKDKKEKKEKKSKKFGCSNINNDVSLCDADGETDDRTGYEACPQSCGICALTI